MRPFAMLLACAVFAGVGCVGDFRTFSGSVRKAAHRVQLQRPIGGAVVRLHLPTRVFQAVAGPEGKFELRYSPGQMNLDDLANWVALAERRGFFTDILRIGRHGGIGGVVRRHTFLLVENNENASDELAAFQKALRYLSEDAVERRAFAICALGILAARTAADKRPGLKLERNRAVEEIASVLKNGEVGLRRLAARKIGLFRSHAALGALRGALDDEDEEVRYWSVRTLAELLGGEERTCDFEAPPGERVKVIKYWKELLDARGSENQR